MQKHSLFQQLVPKRSILLLMLSLICASACTKDDENDDTAAEWNYESTDWQNMGYSECGGKVQSPIDIQTANTVKASLSPISFNYKALPIDIIDNGHSIMVNVKNGSSITVNGTTFQLKQFHFHHLSEHKIDGKPYDMELHLVHQDSLTSDMAVVAVFLKQGNANATIQSVFDHIPSVKNKEEVSTTTIDLYTMLPSNQKYYNYTGSLTTPPCSQGLNWLVLKTPVEISSEQIRKFTSYYENDARPVQPLNNRPVLEGI